MKSKIYNIFICDNIPSLNKGEETILDGMLKGFEFLGNTQVAMLTARPEIDRPRYQSKLRLININDSWLLNGGLNSGFLMKTVISIIILLQHLIFAGFYRISKKLALRCFNSSIWHEYDRSDVLVEGHNGTFGIGGDLGIPYYYLVYLPIFAKIIKKKIVFYGGSTCQARSSNLLVNTIYKLSLKSIDLVTLRDRESYQMLKGLNYNKNNIIVTADPAFLLQPINKNKARELLRKEGILHFNNPLIGITVRNKIAFAASSPFDSKWECFSKHNTILSEIFDTLTSLLCATVVFIPHCIGYGNELDDRIIASAVYERCTNKNQVSMITNEYSAAELKGIIGCLDLFLGERLHSVVNAISMSVPSIAIGRKQDPRLDIIRMFGQSNAIYFVDNLDKSTLMDKIVQFWDARREIKKELEEQNASMQKKAMLNGQLLKEFFDSWNDKNTT